MELIIKVRKIKSGKILEKPAKLQFFNGEIDEELLNAATGLKYLEDNQFYSIERDGMLYFDKLKDGREDWKCKLSKKFDKDKEVYQDVFLAMKKISEDANKFDFPCAFEELYIGKSDSCDPHQKSEDKKDKEFTSRFMPNVKFKTFSCSSDAPTKVNFLRLGLIINSYYFTNSEGFPKRYETDNQFFCDHDLGEVNAYEAIPELVPDGMVYDKDSNSLIVRFGTFIESTRKHKEAIDFLLTDVKKDFIEKELAANEANYKNGIINIKQYVDKKIEIEFKKRGL